MRSFVFLAILVLVVVSLIPATLLAQDAPTVTIVTCWGGAEGVGFNATNAVFTEATGIEVEHIDDRDCHLLPQIMASAGNPPDISAMPRPGVMAQLAREGLILPLTGGDDPILPDGLMEDNYSQALIDLGTVDGQLYGVISSISAKSTAWRRSDVFEEIGEDAPTTWDEFIEYLDILAEEGLAPIALGALDGWDAHRLLRESLSQYRRSGHVSEALCDARSRMDRSHRDQRAGALRRSGITH